MPKKADGLAEMVRQLKIARDTAVKARASAVIALKQLLVNAPGEVREALKPLTDAPLLVRCARLVPGELRTPAVSVRHALRALARRCRLLSEEIATHDAALDALTAEAVPTLRAAFGMGVDVAAEMLIVAGDNPERIRSEAAFAKLCGACPIPAELPREHPPRAPGAEQVEHGGGRSAARCAWAGSATAAATPPTAIARRKRVRRSLMSVGGGSVGRRRGSARRADADRPAPLARGAGRSKPGAGPRGVTPLTQRSSSFGVGRPSPPALHVNLMVAPAT